MGFPFSNILRREKGIYEGSKFRKILSGVQQTWIFFLHIVFLKAKLIVSTNSHSLILLIIWTRDRISLGSFLIVTFWYMHRLSIFNSFRFKTCQINTFYILKSMFERSVVSEFDALLVDSFVFFLFPHCM